MTKLLLIACLLTALVCAGASAAPDTIASVRARAHKEIAQRDAQIAALQHKLNQFQPRAKTDSALSLNVSSPDTPKLAQMVQDYNDAVLEYMTDKADATLMEMYAHSDLSNSESGLRSGDTAFTERCQREFEADTAKADQKDAAALAAIQRAVKLYAAILSAPDVLTVYQTTQPYFPNVEPPMRGQGIQSCFALVSQTPGAVNLCRIVKK